jgi:carboxyl-terminal processing protease
MKKTLSIIVIVLCYYCTYAQSITNKVARNAFIITRMADKFHIQPKPVNDSFSSYVFKAVLQQLDEDKIFFTIEDIVSFLPYRFTLDQEVLQQKSAFLQLLAARYEARLEQADTMIANICKQPFNFSLRGRQKTSGTFTSCKTTRF